MWACVKMLWTLLSAQFECFLLQTCHQITPKSITVLSVASLARALLYTTCSW
ncbi:hypothetical protein M758_1G058500 [Ceratodon purpureus]|nr:hypothetical protein M758_1G058500 [Ceratodon purpureus]